VTNVYDLPAHGDSIQAKHAHGVSERRDVGADYFDGETGYRLARSVEYLSFDCADRCLYDYEESDH
jgi:hypothetical protein